MRSAVKNCRLNLERGWEQNGKIQKFYSTTYRLHVEFITLSKNIWVKLSGTSENRLPRIEFLDLQLKDKIIAFACLWLLSSNIVDRRLVNLLDCPQAGLCGWLAETPSKQTCGIIDLYAWVITPAQAFRYSCQRHFYIHHFWSALEKNQNNFLIKIVTQKKFKNLWFVEMFASSRRLQIANGLTENVDHISDHGLKSLYDRWYHLTSQKM